MLLFDKSKFDRQRKLYDLDEIKRIKQKKAAEAVDEENGTDGTDGMDGTHSGGVSEVSNHSDSAGNEENGGKINENYEGKGTESNNNDDKVTADTFLHSHNASHVSHTSQTYSDFLLDGVPIWQIENRGMIHEEAEAFKEEVVRIGNGKSKGKLAEMAEANESGKGIMPVGGGNGYDK
jgi:hypothetical protein